MHPRFSALSLTAALFACTCAVPTETPVRGPHAESEELTPHPTPDEIPTRTIMTVAVGSVLLRNDCPDPAGKLDPLVPASTTPAAASPAAEAPAMPARRPPPGPGDQTGSVPARRRCEQSTLQLQFNNEGNTEAGEVRIVEVRLRDANTKTVVATLDARAPSQWSAADNAYVTWDQTLAPRSSLKSSYRIKPPDWHSVEQMMNGADSHGHSFDVQVLVAFAGETVTGESAEFARPPRVIMPPT